MRPEVKTIVLSLPFGLGKVNCYLVKTAGGYVLIDTGLDRQRAHLERHLAGAGCKPGNLVLIVLTHGDTDHAGNCAYLRKKYGARIAIHHSESQVVERGDMTLSRKYLSRFAKTAFLLVGLGRSDRFEPDLYLEDGQDLSAYGFDARVVHLPGHSHGSIGILMEDGDASAGHGQILFCGDLLTNPGKPGLNALMDDHAAANDSLRKLSGLEISTVYPGHGKPFPMQAVSPPA